MMKNKSCLSDIFNYFKKPSNKKHLIGGFLVGFFAFNPWAALYSAIAVGLAMEFKDYLYEHEPELDDFLLTALGGGLAGLFWFLTN